MRRRYLGAQLFFWGRVAHWLIYLTGIPWLRTVAWAVVGDRDGRDLYSAGVGVAAVVGASVTTAGGAGWPILGRNAVSNPISGRNAQTW